MLRVICQADFHLGSGGRPPLPVVLGIKCRVALAIISKKIDSFGLEKINIGPFWRAKLKIILYIYGGFRGPTPSALSLDRVGDHSPRSAFILRNVSSKSTGGASSPGFATNEMASPGQVGIQTPQPIHLPSMISATSPFSLMASIGHLSMHTSHAVQSSGSIFDT